MWKPLYLFSYSIYLDFYNEKESSYFLDKVSTCQIDFH